ncbi:hypothetical protein X777_02629 [Ooceraea biroi]|uniref:Secreted protein n=1 Tax=Ooceraea biroi TaxID=2015173 RepID=A0A026WN45_OOCBI|nr:hypothetical protein X777_02629 [Ooceraea biroi]
MLIPHEIVLLPAIIALMTDILAHEWSNRPTVTVWRAVRRHAANVSVFFYLLADPPSPAEKVRFMLPRRVKKSPNFVNYLLLTWFCLGKKMPSFLKGSGPRVSKRDPVIPLHAVSLDCCGNIKLPESPRFGLQSSETATGMTWDEPTINRKSPIYRIVVP